MTTLGKHWKVKNTSNYSKAQKRFYKIGGTRVKGKHWKVKDTSKMGRDMSGKNNPMYKKHHKLETLEKISKSNIGRKSPMLNKTGEKSPAWKGGKYIYGGYWRIWTPNGYSNVVNL